MNTSLITEITMLMGAVRLSSNDGARPPASMNYLVSKSKLSRANEKSAKLVAGTGRCTLVES